MPCACIGTDEDEEEDVAMPFAALTAFGVSAVPEKAKEDDDEGEDAEQDDEEDAVEGESKTKQPPPAPPSLRVVFLDIDGVLNTRPDPRLVHIEGGPCAMLRRLLAASGAKLVLSSPWRRHHTYIAQVLANFCVFGDTTDEEGAPVAPPELERTPLHADAARRDLEILQWLRARRGEVAAWVALDAADLLRFPSAAHLEGHVVRMPEAGGFGGAELDAALRALGCDPKGFAGAASAKASDDGAGATKSAAATSSAPRKFTIADVPGPTAFKTAAAWDDDLAGKMEAVMGALAPGSSYRKPGVPILMRPPPPAVASSQGGGDAARVNASVPAAGDGGQAAAGEAVPSSAVGAEATKEIFRTAVAWDDLMGQKMEAVLGALAPGSSLCTPGFPVSMLSPPSAAASSQGGGDAARVPASGPAAGDGGLAAAAEAVPSSAGGAEATKEIFRTAAAWDVMLATKMEELGAAYDHTCSPEAVLSAFPPSPSPSEVSPGARASAARSGDGHEFDALFGDVRMRFAPAER
mmetsp:Transcript_98972/g.317359  ORF Transcript_98972/g.317359 Transcript_98972/m.317359 type:complete len:522 (+) Transcript_98972:86-1651(+)